MWIVRDQSWSDYEVAPAMPMLVTSLVFITISKYKVYTQDNNSLNSLFSERRNQAKVSRHSFWAWWTHWKQIGFRGLCDPAPEPRHHVWSAAKYTECRSHEITLIMWMGKMMMKASVTRWKMFLANSEQVWEGSHWLYLFSVAPNISTLFRNV